MSEVPEGTIAEVLAWVGDDRARASAALDAEYAGASRSTLISQLEAIEEAPMSDEPTTATEETELAPAPEPPSEVLIDPADEGTVISAVAVRDSDVEPDFDLTPSEEDNVSPIDGEQVEYLQAAGGTNGVAIAINGTVYLFGSGMAASLKQIVDKAIAGISY